MKLLLKGAVAVVVVYLALCGALALVMMQPPERFGRIIRHIPMPLAWGLLPGPRIWMWARRGALSPGDAAPDFTLARHDGTGRVTLSSHRGDRPVVLVFGSYT
jgi:hypothetical protein